MRLFPSPHTNTHPKTEFGSAVGPCCLLKQRVQVKGHYWVLFVTTFDLSYLMLSTEGARLRGTIATFRNNPSACESSPSCTEIQGGMKTALRQESRGPGEPRACWASTSSSVKWRNLTRWCPRLRCLRPTRKQLARGSIGCRWRWQVANFPPWRGRGAGCVT